MATEFHLGMPVHGSDGEAGRVEDILVDQQGAPQYLVVRDRGVFGRDAVLPVSGAAVQDDSVHLAMTRAAIHDADRFDDKRHGSSAGLSSWAANRFDAQDDQR